MNGTQRETGREPKAKGEDSAAAAAWRPRPGLGCRAQFHGVGKVGARQPGRGRHARSLRSSTPPWGSPSPPAPPAHAAASDAPAPHARHGPLRAWARPACPAAPGRPSPAPLPPRPAAPVGGAAPLPTGPGVLAAPPARARRPGLAPGPHLSRAPFRRRRPPKMAPLSLCFRSHSLASFPAGPARWGARLGSQGRRKRDKKGQRGRPLGTSEGPSVARGGRAQGRKKVV